MDKDELKRKAQSKKYISGIYNYCDGWCERCAFTSRCLNYEYRAEHYDNPESMDTKNEMFWQKLMETFQMTLEMVREAAEEEGIDLDSLDYNEIEKEQQIIYEKAEKHQCSRLATEYGKIVSDWFENSNEIFDNKENELNLKLELGLSNTKPEEEAVTITEIVDIIFQYQHLVYVKLMRAIQGLHQETDDYPKDSDGSAKVALIGIDRSISAWNRLGNQLPEEADEILDILVHLVRLRKGTEETFPNARKFIRPGFDNDEIS